MNDDFTDFRDSLFSEDDDANFNEALFENDDAGENDALFDETLFNDTSDLVDDLPSFEPEEESLDDEFDQLRRKSARGETMHGGLESEEVAAAAASSGSRFSMRNFSPMQRFIIALLVVLDLGMIVLGVLVVSGIIG